MLEYTEKPDEGLLKEAGNYIQLRKKFLMMDEQKNIIQVGTRVIHRVFGEGVVQEIDNDNSAYLIQFLGMDTARKISFRVKLEVKGTGKTNV